MKPQSETTIEPHKNLAGNADCGNTANANNDDNAKTGDNFDNAHDKPSQRFDSKLTCDCNLMPDCRWNKH